MAKKIYLSPAAHGHDNPCSYSKECGENVHCNAYMDELEPYLKAAGFAVKRNPANRTGDRLHEAIEEANAWGADLYYIAHTNAGGGSYSKIMVYNKGTAYGYAEKLAAERRALFAGEGKGWTAKVTVEPQWAELKQTKAPALYDEMVFHDNADQIAWFHGHMREMAAATAKAVCAMFGVPFVDPYAGHPASNTLYRVQTGAYSALSNADRAAEALQNKGYPTYIVRADGLYKVQVGAYQDKGNAQRMADKLQADGFAVYITTEKGTAVPTPEEPSKPTLKVGCKVHYSGRLYATSTGGGAGKTVDGTYTVSRYLKDKSHGVLLNGGLGWVKPGDCEVVG